MEILILDVYPSASYRITKDTNGGYGTSNDYGDGLVATFLKWLVGKSLDWPPLHAVYSAAVLREQGHSVTYSRELPDGRRYDFVILPSSIVAHETELAAVRAVRTAGMPAVVTGPFATSRPSPYNDAGAVAILGEPEMYFAAHDLTVEAVNAFLSREPAGPSLEIDALPLPAWDLIIAANPPRYGFTGGGKTTLPIVASRGCPYSCFNYCTYPLQQGRKLRLRSPEAIVREMAYWQDTLSVSSFIFRDPVFAINRKHTLALCDELDRSGRQFRFVIEAHIKNLDEDLANRLRKAGLEMVYVGIESEDVGVLENIDRFTATVDEQKTAIRRLEGLGIKVKTMFMFGCPTDTVESCLKTLDYAINLRTAFTQFGVFTPYPGTPVFHEFENKIIAKNYEEFTQWHLVYKHNNITPEQIREILSTAFRRYYTNPVWFLKFLKAYLA